MLSHYPHPGWLIRVLAAHMSFLLFRVAIFSTHQIATSLCLLLNAVLLAKFTSPYSRDVLHWGRPLNQKLPLPRHWPYDSSVKLQMQDSCGVLPVGTSIDLLNHFHLVSSDFSNIYLSAYIIFRRDLCTTLRKPTQGTMHFHPSLKFLVTMTTCHLNANNSHLFTVLLLKAQRHLLMACHLLETSLWPVFCSNLLFWPPHLSVAVHLTFLAHSLGTLM